MLRNLIILIDLGANLIKNPRTCIKNDVKFCKTVYFMILFCDKFCNFGAK